MLLRKLFKRQTHPSLSIEEFLGELEQARDSFDWYLQPDIRPGAERRSSPRFWIWAAPHTVKGLCLDPVEAVCYAMTGKHDHWRKAAEKIGLSPADAESLHAAVTDRTWQGDGKGHRRPNQRLSVLRSRIIEAIGDRFNLKSSSHSSYLHTSKH